MVARVRSDRILRLGPSTHWWRDPYHHALTIPWWAFLLLTCGVYAGANAMFAGLYLLQPNAVAHVAPRDFADAFFFSVQTMATIGYGVLVPQTAYANILVAIEALLGMLMLAITTGLMFARFARPTARVLFSRNAVIGVYDGEPTLFVRVANERSNQIVEASATMTLVRDETTREGMTIRRFHDLHLARSRTPIFAMTYLLMHGINTASKLHGVTADSFAAMGGEIVVTISGLDETMAQTIHARASYAADDLLWGHRFLDIFGYTDDGRRAIDFSRFHHTEPL
jgi:inward rectifier potassium channel